MSHKKTIDTELNQIGFKIGTGVLLHVMGLRIGYKPVCNYSKDVSDLRFMPKFMQYRTMMADLVRKLKPHWDKPTLEEKTGIAIDADIVLLDRAETFRNLELAEQELTNALNAIQDFRRVYESVYGKGNCIAYNKREEWSQR